METEKTIKTRRSIRKFLDVPIKLEQISEIIECARYAPTAGNVQPWKFIVVEDEPTIKGITSCCYDQFWINSAQAIIVICADIEKSRQVYGIRGEKLYSIQDCANAATIMLLRANDLGLGGCWIGAFDEEELKSILSIPDHMRPQIVLALGYPAEKPPLPTKRDAVYITYFEKYGNAQKPSKVWPLKKTKEKVKSFLNKLKKEQE